MTVTEDEARTFACCAATKRSLQMPCIGSTCMAWRWIGAEREQWRGPFLKPGETPQPPDNSGQWVLVETPDPVGASLGLRSHLWERQANRRGYCGLAGRP